MFSKMRWIFVILLLAGMLTALASQPQVGQAQAPVATPATPASPLTTVAPIIPTAPPPPASLPPEARQLTLTFAQWGYSDVTLSGPTGVASYDLGLPSNWQMLPGGSISLLLDYAVTNTQSATASGGTPMVIGTPVANVQAILNGKLISQIDLTETGAQTMIVNLPDVWPPKAGDRDRFQVLLHVYGPCVNTQFTTLTISQSSVVNLYYKQGPLALDLANFPAPFYQRTFLPAAATMVLPDQASGDETAAGLAVAAGLGARSQNRVALSAITSKDWDATKPITDNLFVVGTPENNLLIAELAGNPELPLHLRPRQLSLIAIGPVNAAPDSTLTYQFTVSNPETAAQTGLALEAHLPVSVTNVTCSPDCVLDQGAVHWDLPSLEASGAASLNLEFSLPANQTISPIMVGADLLKDGQLVNGIAVKTDVTAAPTGETQRVESTGQFFFSENGHAVPQMDGVLLMAPSPWNTEKAVLLVTGLDDTAVLKAARALAANARFPGLLGQGMRVEDTLPITAAQADVPMQFSLEELGYTDQTVTGIGPKEIFYQFDMPIGWALSQQASVELNFSHSALLDPTQSALTLLFNNKPVATVALDKTNVIDGKLVGALPPGAARPGRPNTLLVQAMLMLPDRCVDPNTTQAWLTIASSSTVNLAHSTQPITGMLTDMNAWPLPFVDQPDLSDVTFALPANPQAAEFTAAAKIASYLGSGSGGSGFRPIAELGDPAPEQLAGQHLIVIGRPTRNPVLQQANNQLPQPFEPGSDGIRQQVDRIVVGLPQGLDLGYLQALGSPWDAEKAMLAVTGTSDNGVNQAANMLVDSALNWQLQGNLALLRDGKLATLNTGSLTAAGRATAIATIVPEAAVAGTATPTPVPTAASGAQTAPGAEATPPSYPERYPYLIPMVVGISLLVILIIAVFAFRQSRLNKM